MLYLSQDPSEHSTLTGGSTLTNIVTISACDDSLDSSNSDAERKKSKSLWKVKLNDSKVESASERGAKKMLLETFNVLTQKFEAPHQETHRCVVLSVNSTPTKKLPQITST